MYSTLLLFWFIWFIIYEIRNDPVVYRFFVEKNKQKHERLISPQTGGRLTDI